MQRFGAVCQIDRRLHSFVAAKGPEAFTGEGRRYFAGRCFCYWQDGRRALGTLMFGAPRESDIAEMIPFWDIGTKAVFAGHSSFVDGRDLEAVDVLALKRLLHYVMARGSAWGPNIARQAILHPGGLVGVMVAGALHVARPPNPFQTFAGDAAAAFEYAGVRDLLAEVEAVRRDVTGAPEILREVRSLLRSDWGLSSARLARAMGLSERTLQRRLEAAGSSLRAERNRELSRVLEELLAGTELDLDAIAAQVGLTSASHLVRHFRATHGVTPGEWRAQRR